MKHNYAFHIVLKSSWPIAIASMIILVLSNCQHGNNQHDALLVSAKNPSSITQDNYLVVLSKNDFPAREVELDLSILSVFSGEKEIASQYNDEKIYFMIDKIEPGAESQFILKNVKSETTFPKRTQAEISVKNGGYFENRKYIGGDFENVNDLRVPDEHTDHSFYIRYEGPGWESDLVGYRFYLDWRNATDAFGKKTSEMVLQQVGLDGFDSYHEMQDWGMDVLKVGSSLGVGSLAMYSDDKAVRVDKTDSVTCEIADNGVVYSSIKTNYYGWNVSDVKYDVESKISIHAGTRLTHHEILISGEPDNLCTGIGKDSKANLYTDQGSAEKWGYLATYGLQSLNNDKLGLAVFFSNKDYKGFTEDEFSHIVKLKVNGGDMDYYFLAAWEGEKNGINSEDEFLVYVQQTAIKLANPLKIDIKE